MIKIARNILIIAFHVSNAFANSFVGNGGTAGDIEILVTKKQIYESLKKVSESEEFTDYCECIPVFNSRNICAPLDRLNDEQKKYCTLQLKNSSTAVIELLDNPKLSINWTNEVINIESNNKTITADAVANSESKSIIIHKKSFMNLPQIQRVFLLTHELLHLVPIDGGYIGDTGEIGPFKGDQGQRELLNSMASETVMQGYRYGLFQKYQQTLSRGQSYHKSWIDFNIIHIRSLDQNSNTYNSDSYSGVELNYKYFMKNFGLNLGFKSALSSEELLTTIEVEEQLSVFSLGLAYRFFMGDDALTAYGQSFLTLDANIDFVSSNLNVSDSFISQSSTDRTNGYSVNANYYYPLNPFWIKFGLGFSQSSYEHESFNLEKNAINVIGNVGVSYGF